MLFEILPVLVYQLAGTGLTELPVELIAGILRYLDPESLLNVAKTYRTCKEVALGDPILRRRLRKLLKEKDQLETEKKVNPALAVTVTRREPGRMFGENQEKLVTVCASTKTEGLADIQKDFSGCRKRKNKEYVVGLPTSKRCNYRL